MELVESWNDFSAAEIIPHLRAFDRKRYYNPDNPNNAGDAFIYWFGIEMSPVIYIGPNLMWHKMAVLSSDMRSYAPYSFADAKRDVARLVEVVKPTEFSIETVRPFHCERLFRLWWD